LTAMAKVVSLPDTLRGKWVAYKLDKDIHIIDYDEDFETLLEKLRKKGVDVRFVQVDYVPDEDVVFLV